MSFGRIASGLFSNDGSNLIDVASAPSPNAGQTLITTSPTTVEWQTPVTSIYTAGLGIDSTQLALDVIQLETSARFIFTGNALDLNIVSVSYGGSGVDTLTNNGVLIGQGINPIDTSKQAPIGDFVGTSDTQSLTNKTMTSNTNDITSRALFSDSGLNTIDVSSAANPLAGQVLTAINATSAEWSDTVSPLIAGLGVDSTQLSFNTIQLETTPRFTFSGNALELNIIPISYGGTGVGTLTLNGVLIGQGVGAVDTSKQAPTGDFVGDTDTQTLTNKTMTDSTNNVTCTGLFSNNGLNTISVNASADPTAGQLLTAINATSAEWQTFTLQAGLGIDATQLALNIIQLETTARFTYSTNALELSTVTVEYGGSGQTTLTNNGVLIGQGVNPIDSSKQAPIGDFVGTSDTQTLTNKTMTSNTNDITCSALFSNSGLNTISVNASANPLTDQVLTATSATTATWQSIGADILSAGLGVDDTQLALNVIQLEVTARFTFTGNALELAIISPEYGGTGVNTLTNNGVLIGQGVNPIDSSKQAPIGDFVGTSDTQTLTNKTITDSTNDVTCTGFFTDSGANTVNVSSSANPVAGQLLTAVNATSATWQTFNVVFVQPSSVGTSITTSAQFLNLNQELVNTAPTNFSLVSGNLQINDTGTYEIVFGLTVVTNGTGGSSTDTTVAIQLRADTGVGFINISNANSGAYVREANTPVLIITLTNTFIYTVSTPGTLIQLEYQQTNDVDCIYTRPAYIIMKKLI